MGIPVLKIRPSWQRLIFNMGIPILARRLLYIETPHGSLTHELKNLEILSYWRVFQSWEWSDQCISSYRVQSVLNHYNNVTMGSIASQINSLTIVYSAVYWSKKTSKLRVTGLCAGYSPGTGEFPAQVASNAEYVSIWWRHHVWEHFVRYIFITLTSSIWRMADSGW